MTTLTKVFIVVLAVFAIAFSMLVIQYTAQSTNFRTLAEENRKWALQEQAAREAANNKQKVVVAHLNKVVTTLQDQLAAQNRELDKMASTLANVKNELLAEQGKNASLMSQSTQLTNMSNAADAERKGNALRVLRRGEGALAAFPFGGGLDAADGRRDVFTVGGDGVAGLPTDAVQPDFGDVPLQEEREIVSRVGPGGVSAAPPERSTGMRLTRRQMLRAGVAGAVAERQEGIFVEDIETPGGIRPFKDPYWAPTVCAEIGGHRWIKMRAVAVTPENCETIPVWSNVVKPWFYGKA